MNPNQPRSCGPARPQSGFDTVSYAYDRGGDGSAPLVAEREWSNVMKKSEWFWRPIEFLGLTAVVVLLMWSNGCRASGEPGAPVISAEFRVTTPDSVVLVMDWLSAPANDTLPVPVVVLLPMMNHDRGSWHGFDTLLATGGFKVVSIDQRGHGASTRRGGEAYSLRQFTNTDFGRMVDDVGLILSASQARAADLSTNQRLDSILTATDFTQVVIVGASIGSSVALLYGADHSQVAGLVLLSPGLNYRGMATEPAIKRYHGRPIFLAAATEDKRSVEAINRLYDLSNGDVEVARGRVITTGGAHGTNLFDPNPELRSELIDWIRMVLD
jgi:pimeloyl-ACP methyl ester carboxylesterase